ncbi:transposase [Bacteroides caccae]|nr:transposase [Bacteroides caccae]
MGAKKDGSFCDRYANEKESIKLIFHEHKGRYGYRRVIAEMHNLWFHVKPQDYPKAYG